MFFCSFIPRQRVFFSGPPCGEAASGVNGREVDLFVYIYVQMYILAFVGPIVRKCTYLGLPVLLETFQPYHNICFGEGGGGKL